MTTKPTPFRKGELLSDMHTWKKRALAAESALTAARDKVRGLPEATLMVGHGTQRIEGAVHRAEVLAALGVES